MFLSLASPDGAITVGFVLMNERFAFFDDMGISKGMAEQAAWVRML